MKGYAYINLDEKCYSSKQHFEMIKILLEFQGKIEFISKDNYKNFSHKIKKNVIEK